jgi:protein CpxP
MKKLFIVALLVLGLNGFAQEASPWSKKKLDKMTTELSLTEEQQKLMLPLFDEQKALYDDIKANPDNKEADKAKIKEIAKKMNLILTPEQKQTQKALKSAAKKED